MDFLGLSLDTPLGIFLTGFLIFALLLPFAALVVQALCPAEESTGLESNSLPLVNDEKPLSLRRFLLATAAWLIFFAAFARLYVWALYAFIPAR
jgi:hypothetical protein